MSMNMDVSKNVGHGADGYTSTQHGRQNQANGNVTLWKVAKHLRGVHGVHQDGMHSSQGTIYSIGVARAQLPLSRVDQPQVRHFLASLSSVDE